MLRPSHVQFRHAYDVLRRSPVLALDALRRRLTGLFFVDETLREQLILVRPSDKAVHFRRLPTKRPRRARPCPPPHLARTPHQRAVRRLQLELQAGDGLTCVFHDGMCIRPERVCLIPASNRVDVHVEVSHSIGGTRLVPDILISCPETGRALLAIEVCATHPVGATKQAAYARAGVQWVEVRAMQVICRFRRRPICAENWSGATFPEPPGQLALKLPERAGDQCTRSLEWQQHLQSID
jgi:hypothetical protein